MEKNIVSIHQPNLFPRLKVLQKIYNSNTYICYDDVQFVRNDWQNRVFLRNSKDLRSFWMVIPVNKPNGQKSKINEIEIIDANVTASIIERQLYYAYVSSPYWKEVKDYIGYIVSDIRKFDLLADYLYYSLQKLVTIICPDVKIVRSSGNEKPVSSEKNMHLIDLCKWVNGTDYICGSGGLNYIDSKIFEKNGINLLIQNWEEEKIKSRYCDIPWRNYSFIDFWARYGLEELKNCLGGI